MATIEADWLATLRARAGFTYGRSLIYATGGAAFSDISFSQENTYDLLGTQEFSSSSIETGWVLGGGIEHNFGKSVYGKNWTIKAEYLYTDFGDITDGDAPFEDFVGDHEHSADLSMSVFRLGVNVHF